MLWLLLDTNVALSALLWTGAPARLLAAQRSGLVALFTSSELLDELADVLGRRRIAPRLAAVGETPVSVLARYRRRCRLVTAVNVDVPGLRDIDDLAVFNAAVGAGVDAIVTGDQDILVLREFRGIEIIKPAEAATRLGV